MHARLCAQARTNLSPEFDGVLQHLHWNDPEAYQTDHHNAAPRTNHAPRSRGTLTAYPTQDSRQPPGAALHGKGGTLHRILRLYARLVLWLLLWGVYIICARHLAVPARSCVRIALRVVVCTEVPRQT